MKYSTTLLPLLWALASCHEDHVQVPIADQGASISGIAPSTREYWMRKANSVLPMLSSPCPFDAFGSVIVNHTDAIGLGDLVCIGLNAIGSGNPTLHGEISAITNCTKVLTDADGPYKLNAGEALAAFKDLSIYTNGEPCPMCASAIRWAGFRECIYGTEINTLIKQGWGQIRMTSHELFKRSFGLPTQASLIGPVLANETDPLFAWQFDPEAKCPKGCERGNGGICEES